MKEQHNIVNKISTTPGHFNENNPILIMQYDVSNYLNYIRKKNNFYINLQQLTSFVFCYDIIQCCRGFCYNIGQC